MTTDDSPKVLAHLSKHYQKTYDALLRHPTPHNLEWHDIRSLLSTLADVVDGDNGTIHVTRNGESVTIHAPKHKEVSSVETLLSVRHFLERSSETAQPSTAASPLRLLVVIDHREARIYHAELHGTIPEQLVPYDPHGFGRHLRAEVPETAGKREPERKSFYEAIVKTLRGADEIVIFGTGTGKSSAMDHLVAELNHFHGDVASHVIGSIVVDEHHLTENQLLARARECFATANANHST